MDLDSLDSSGSDTATTTSAESSLPIAVGDPVWYVPHVNYALTHNNRRDYPWLLGYKGGLPRRGVVREKRHGDSPDYEVLDTPTRVRQVLEVIRKHPDRREINNLVFIKPIQFWRARVTAIRGNTLSLDVVSNTGGVTLHENGVVYDPSKTVPHSCHKA